MLNLNLILTMFMIRVQLMSICRNFAILIVLFSGVACVPPVDEEVFVVEEPKDRLVARVASIHLKEGYTLMQRYGRLKVGDSAILYSMSASGEVANLKVTGERLGQFLAADIISGTPSIGDAIYLRNIDVTSDPKVTLRVFH